MQRLLSIPLFILVILALCRHCPADDHPDIEQLTFFETKIRPVLVEHCYQCHAASAKILQGGLRVDDREGLLNGGDSGPAIVPKQPDHSLLLAALRYEEFEMPPKGKLADSVLKDFETWITMGAPDPRQAVADTPSRTIDLDEGRKHWAFQPMTNPQAPAVRNEHWPLDPLDHFIMAPREAAGLKPVADADRYTWLRRVSLDLTGLPPTPSEIEAFIHDDSPQAFDAVVDRLLNSRAFGERWARHWLDLTGYADMMGTSNNVFAEHAWRYRDYLIDAFHHDKPFDQFVREQIAGDLLPATSPQEQAENIVATGFLMVGDVEIVEPDKTKMEADHIDTQVSKIGTALLGMTLGCVRCHDHKFDPITTSDYYSIAGMLRSSPSTHKIPFGVWSSLNTTDLPETPEQITARQKLESEHAEKLAAMKGERDRLEGEKKAVVEQLAQFEQAEKSSVGVAGAAAPPAEELAPAQGRKEALTNRRDELAGQIRELASAILHAEFFSSKVPRAYAMRDGDDPADMPIHIRGNAYALGRVVPRGAIQVASWEGFPEIPAGQSGRLQLADWLADRRNPLTARVTVNRIWQKLFGEGLVRSVDYFGTRGETPSHPELLDHLATRFMESGWSQKQLIRELVLSRTYRMTSTNYAAAIQVDPENRLLWRMNRQRLDAEAVRDSLLAISGELQSSDGGPALVYEEVGNWAGRVRKGVNPPSYTHRTPRAGEEFVRTIYLPVMRTNTATHDRLRSFFDFVNPAQIAGQRSQTVVPTQVLFVMNNDLFRARAKALADRLIVETPQVDARLEQLWLRVFGRPITDTERSAATTFLVDLDSAMTEANENASESLRWQELCHSLLASNEFIFRL